MPRGGKRNGTAGKSYANRTDLNTGGKVPATAAPGQAYGQAGQQMQAQQAMPIAPQPTPAGPSGGAAPSPGPAGVLPGSLGKLDRPTDRPDEPLTAGAPVGPGPASMSLPSAPDPLLSTVAALNSLGDALPPMLRGVVTQLQAAQGNGLGG